MFDSYHYYIFILLLMFSILLSVFNGFVVHHYFIDIISWILPLIPIFGFMYHLRFRDGTVTPFYVLFCALLAVYVVVFAGMRIYAIFNPIQGV
ncbi:MAG: hypothetical protein NUV61_03715 [Candidatus Azambacteria bacterium]|nr:hypothetical protein [Candidatus Azambacteria bacterium]